jgi:hypothetical protein
MADANLTAARLRELLHYDPDTGAFTRRFAELTPKGGVRKAAGTVIGRPMAGGYVRVGVAGRRYLANVLAWLYMTGQWPRGDVDHRDGDPSNNRWKNLRDVAHQQNIENRRHANKNNTCGLLGVHASGARGRWTAAIHVGGRKTHLGSFGSPEEAHAAYVEAKRRLHAGCTL